MNDMDLTRRTRADILAIVGDDLAALNDQPITAERLRARADRLEKPPRGTHPGWAPTRHRRERAAVLRQLADEIGQGSPEDRGVS